MGAPAELRFARRPSTAAYMLRAFRRSPLRRPGAFPPLRATWRGHRPDPAELADFLRLTGLAAGGELPLLYPYVFGFPLLMAMLTHPSFPLPIWRVLLIRNRMAQHRPLPAGATLDLEARVADQRILEKGVEVELHTSVRAGPELAWESATTFYYRGRFGAPGPAPAGATAPEAGGEVVARWTTPRGGGWRLGGFTGDYNGVHWSDRYARLQGFRRAFHHPQVVLGQAMARLPAPGAGSQRLDAWVKGPVYYGSDVALRAARGPDGTAFAVLAGADPRPAILGRWRSLRPGSSLLDADDP